jgi:hypothetical protein
MISVDAPTYELVMRVLREVAPLHPEARSAADKMLLAGIECETRDIEFNFDVPALCGLQAD